MLNLFQHPLHLPLGRPHEHGHGSFTLPNRASADEEKWALKQVQGDGVGNVCLDECHGL
jgi:hypothetical protein